MRGSSWAVAITLLSVLATGCNGPAVPPGAGGGAEAPDGSVPPSTPPGTAEGPPDGGAVSPPRPAALVRLVHVAPDLPAVDVYAQGQATPLFRGVEYRNVTQGMRVPLGTYSLLLRYAGEAPTAPPLLESEPVLFEDGAEVTAVAAGLLSTTDLKKSARLLAVVTPPRKPVEGLARARVVHAGPDAPSPLDVDVGDDGRPDVLGVGRFQDSGPSSLSVVAGVPQVLALRERGARLASFTVPGLEGGGEPLLVLVGLQAAADDKHAFGLLVVSEDHATFVRPAAVKP